MSLSIIILAAGKGTRLKSTRFKVFHEVGNLPMLYHVINKAYLLKPEKCIVVISQEMISLKKNLLLQYPKLKISVQNKQNGTADAVQSAKSLLSFCKDDLCLILYGDSPLLELQTLKKLIKKIKTDKSDLSLLTMKPKDPKCYGRIVLNANKSIKKIKEYSEANDIEKKISLCNSGIMIAKNSIIKSHCKKIKNNNKKNEFYLTDIVEILVNDGKKVSYDICDYNETLGVNDRKDLLIVENEYQKKMRNFFLNNGVTLIDPKSIYFSFDTIIGKDAIIQPNVYFGKNVIIGENVRIKSFSHLEGVKINKNCEVGPFARIRPESILEKNVKVGNFVEIKQSIIKNDTNVSHLSYIGDATIGNNTNIGAGSITCNYDGIRKNNTKIGNNCFIGSNTSLIAPLTIGDNSIIGAGSVVKKNVPKETTIFRKSELIKKNNNS